MSDIQVRIADFSRTKDAQALIQLMQEYARDPMGGGVAIDDAVLASLPLKLQSYTGAFSVIAWRGETPVGLTNCFETLSSFKVRPLINVHDVIVTKASRGLGVAPEMLKAVEREANVRSCCKLTLEVLEGNQRAQEVYLAFGFSGYELDEKYGKALFWEKAL